MKEGWESWDSSLEKKRLVCVCDLTKIYQFLLEGTRDSSKATARLFSVVFSDRTGGNRHKMKCRKFYLNRTGWRVSILEDTQNLTGHSPEKPALPVPAWTRWSPQVLSNLNYSVTLGFLFRTKINEVAENTNKGCLLLCWIWWGGCNWVISQMTAKATT